MRSRKLRKAEAGTIGLDSGTLKRLQSYTPDSHLIIRLAMRATSLLLFLLGLTSMAACQGATEPIDYHDFTKSEGEGELGIWVHSGFYNRLYFLHTPPDLEEGTQYPLLIFLHGAGDDGEGFQQWLRAHEVTDSAGFITVYPDGLEGTWTMGCQESCTFAEELEADDVSFLNALAGHLADHLPVDTARVYVAGYSQGGSLAYLFGCQSPRPPAGVAVVSGLMLRNVAENCRSGVSFPVLVSHGTSDLLAYYEGFGDEAPFLSVPGAVEFWRQGMGCGAEPIREDFPDEAGDFTTVTSFLFPDCDPGASVLHYRINGGGHTWPGNTGPWWGGAGLHSRNLDLTRKMVEFFLSLEVEG